MVLDNPPSIDDIRIRKELDQLIKDIIGNFLSEKDQETVNKVLLKTICGDISIEIAIVAIKEIVLTYYSKEEKTEENKEQLNAYYNKGYR